MEEQITKRILMLTVVATLTLAILGGAKPASAQTIEVNTTADVVDFGGAQRLADLPGSDGVISLREAVIAANNTAGAQNITFVPSLDGQTITLTSPLNLTGGNTTIDGDRDGDGAPNIIVDGGGVVDVAFNVFSNNNTISGLHLKNFTAVVINVLHDTSLGTLEISGTVVSHNVIEDGDLGVLVGAGFSSTTNPGTVRDTTVTENMISGMNRAGILVATRAIAGSLIDQVDISSNQILENKRYGVLILANNPGAPELAGSHTTVSHVTITDNTVTGQTIGTGANVFGIYVDSFYGHHNTIDGVTIARNTVLRHLAGIVVRGGFGGASFNIVTNVLIEDNTTANSMRPVFIAGIGVSGGFSSAHDNTVDAIVRRNRVIDNKNGGGIGVIAAEENSSNNTMTVEISDNIVENNAFGISARAAIAVVTGTTGVSGHNTLDVSLLRNIVGRHVTTGISLAAGTGKFQDGQSDDAMANSNRIINAKVLDNIVEDVGAVGISLVAGNSGKASDNTILDAQVEGNTVCGSTRIDIYAVGGFLGVASAPGAPNGFPPNAGTGNQVTGTIKDNTATGIVVADGVAGNSANMTQTNNKACPGLCYKIKDAKGNICSAEAPINVGGQCSDETDCGGSENTDYCVPKGFQKKTIMLRDEFETERTFEVTKPVSLCNSATYGDTIKVTTPIHFEEYQIKAPKGAPKHEP
jgi:hypothetical protein